MHRFNKVGQGHSSVEGESGQSTGDCGLVGHLALLLFLFFLSEAGPFNRPVGLKLKICSALGSCNAASRRSG
jgi:hypothetical protein